MRAQRIRMADCLVVYTEVCTRVTTLQSNMLATEIVTLVQNICVCQA